MRVTVFTPSYNSVNFIGRVWTSLLAQTCKDFEWLVIDDGSSDGTPKQIEQWASVAPFPVRLIVKASNVGLPNSYNMAFREARGEFLLMIGHDDSFTANAVERFLEVWDSIPSDKQAGFAGVVAACVDDEGHPIGRPLPTPVLDTNALDFYYVLGYRHERWAMLKTSVAGEYPFPEIDKYVQEGTFFFRMARAYRLRFVDDPLRIYHTREAGSLSKSAGEKFLKGMHYSYQFRLDETLDYLVHDRTELMHALQWYDRYSEKMGMTRREARLALQKPAARRLLLAYRTRTTIASAYRRSDKFLRALMVKP